MPRGKKTVKIETTAQSYDHKQETTLRPDIGLQAQFKQKRDPKKYRYDSSLAPELSWDINTERERAEALIAKIRDAKTLEEAISAASMLVHLSKPFLNWTGKAENAEFTVPTLPLFVHERLSTKAILESLKRRKRDKTQQMTLFGDVELDLMDRILRAYEHKAPWVNRIILGDSLLVMNSLLEYEGMGGKVQMIYMDPPYGVKFGSNFQPFIRKRDVKHGDDQSMTREPEMVQAYRDTWELGIHSYLTYLRDRFLVARELLTEMGSIFVQISDENVHHVRELKDEVFGVENFVSEIVLIRGVAGLGELLSNVNDVILWYAKDKDSLKYNYKSLFVVGFSAQANATKFIQNCAVSVGIPATYVNATMDILMGDLLKTSRASQIFSVTGQPEIKIIKLDSKEIYQVELLGLDVFKPDTMETDHTGGGNVPAWFLDTDYNELAFHVSQAFFPRTSAWDNLKRALKATYNDSVWEHLAGTVSEPFEVGENKRIAVKVIDDRGNELMVVKRLDETEGGKR
jgi:hypothetical protein